MIWKMLGYRCIMLAMISEVTTKVSKINFQFHATTKDISEFVFNTLYNQQYIACGVILFPFELENISIDSNITDFNRYDMIMISKEKIVFCDNYREFINKQDNNLGITIGHEEEDKLKESSMWVYSDTLIDQAWKRIINKYKKSLLKGAWVVNPVTKKKSFNKNHRYTVSAKHAYENGIQMCPIAGENIYELVSEQDME